MPTQYKRTFDVVTCTGGLGTNLLPARCFHDMLNALKPGGFIIFTVSQKHLQERDSFKTGYLSAIEKLSKKGTWRPMYHHEYVKTHGFGTSAKEERHSLLVFRKE